MKPEVDANAAIRASLTAGDGTAALERVRVALERSPSPEQAIALRVLGAQAARTLADLGLELAHLEAAEELAATTVPGALGGARLQLGLALLRQGDPRRAASVLGDALPVLVDDPEALARARAAHGDARARALLDPGTSARVARASKGGSGARARAYRLLERLHEADADATADELLVQLLDEAIDATQADRGFVLLAEPDGLKVRVAHDARGQEIVHPHLEVSFAIARAAALEGRTITAMRPAEDPRFAASRSAKRLKLKAVCAAPLRYRRESLGVIVLDQRSEKEGFDREMEVLATELARGAAGIIFRARRHDAERAAHEALVEQYARDAERVRGRFDAEKILGTSPPIARLLRLLEKIAARETRVLIRGESGTGKELVARTIHDNSPRKKKPFVAVNCGALADTVLEAELFGFGVGAFTGATRASEGLLRRAGEGTLFLDEIAEASPRLQVALLRFLEEGEVRPVGENEVVKVDARVLAATHEDLEGLVATGRFRGDLLHRLNTVSVTVPPLRERREDIASLARKFVKEAGKGVGGLTAEIERDLVAREWRGNVRELKNAITQLVTLGTLPAVAGAVKKAAKRSEPGWKDATEGVPTLGDSEKRTILAALAACEGNKSRAAKMLGVSRRGLYYLLEQHGLAGETVSPRR